MYPRTPAPRPSLELRWVGATVVETWVRWRDERPGRPRRTARAPRQPLGGVEPAGRACLRRVLLRRRAGGRLRRQRDAWTLADRATARVDLRRSPSRQLRANRAGCATTRRADGAPSCSRGYGSTWRR